MAMSFSIIEGLGTKVHVVSVMICGYTIVKVKNKLCIIRNNLSFISLESIIFSGVAKNI